MTEIRKKSSEDIISALPDHLLHHILSPIDLKHVIRTSLLSSRWRHLWTSIPTLNLGTWPAGTDTNIPTFITFFLIHYANPKIKKFRAHFHYDDLTDYHVDSWVRFARTRGVEELDLSLYDADSGRAMNRSRYKVLGGQLGCGSLKVLRLAFCEMKLCSLNLGLLKVLELCNVSLTDVDTSGCPVLESLILKDCNTEGHLNIYAPNKRLGCLNIHDINRVRYHYHSAVTIFAPNLQSIQFRGCFRHVYNIKDLSSLKSASLLVYGMHDYLAKAQTTMPLVKLFEYVIKVPNLQLCQWCIQVLFSWEEKGVKFPSFRVTCLKLQTNFHTSELTGIAYLLRNAHYLNSLTLDVRPSTELSRESWSSHFDHTDYFWKSLKCSSAGTQLKIVEISNFLDSGSSLLCEKSELCLANFVNEWEKEIKLVKLLLGSCEALEKMNISTIKMPVWPLKSELLFRLKRRLLKVPRASVNADVHISV